MSGATSDTHGGPWNGSRLDPAVRELTFESYRDLIRTFTDNELIPRENDMVQQSGVPEDVMGRIAELGLFGISIPRQYGGLGWSMPEQVKLTFEFTRASVVYRSRFSTTIGLSARAMLRYGSDRQRAELLPRMATGECVFAFALTEEAAGSDAGAVQTTARPVPGGWRLNGSKRFITNGAWADQLLVFARIPGPNEGDELSCLLVPRRAAGVAVRAAESMNGHAEGPVASIDFDDVFVEQTALLGAPGAGLDVALAGINHARLHVAATAVGQAARLLEETSRFAMQRRQFGQRLIDLGPAESRLGSQFAQFIAAKALILACAESFLTTPHSFREIAAAKLVSTEMVGRLADHAVQILGGTGIVGDHPVPRIWRDVRALRIYEGASEVHERNLARYLCSLTDVSASPGRAAALLQ